VRGPPGPPRTPVFVSSSASVEVTSGEGSLSRRQEDTLHQKARQGPGLELTCLLGSSAARSSVRTILLLLPVFGPRPGKVRWTAGSGAHGACATNHARPVGGVRGKTREQWRQDEAGAQYWSSPSLGRSSATRSSVSTILLLLPVFLLRPALGQVLRDNPPAGNYSEGVHDYGQRGPRGDRETDGVNSAQRSISAPGSGVART